MRDWRRSSKAFFAVSTVVFFGWNCGSGLSASAVDSPDAAPPAVATTAEGRTPSGEPDVIYWIKKGDTLWDITHEQLKDPFLWPKVWQANQRIKNPDLIFPGNRISIPAELAKPKPGPDVVASPPQAEEESVEAPEVAQIPVTVPVRAEPSASALAKKWLRMMSPTIRKEVPTGATVFRAKEDSKEIMATSDEVYLLGKEGESFSVGQTLMIFRIVKKVRHPVTGRFMGNLIRPLALAEVISIDKDVIVTRVQRGVDYIQKGDRAADLAVMTGDSSEPAEAESPVEGVIAEVQEDRLLSADGDIVFLDRGRNVGLKSGDHLTVVRTGKYDSTCCLFRKVKLPDYPIGEVEVLTAQMETATALIVKTNETVLIGDRIISPQ